eukprot:XP_014039636.1 PREDICTED: transmembrane protein 104-like [Salmo salar]
MGQMASMFFNKVGVNMFYICMVVYLYGDLAIYAAAVPISLMEVACGNHSCSAGSVKYDDTDLCWGPVTRKDAYKVFLVSTYCTPVSHPCPKGPWRTHGVPHLSLSAPAIVTEPQCANPCLCKCQPQPREPLPVRSPSHTSPPATLSKCVCP